MAIVLHIVITPFAAAQAAATKVSAAALADYYWVVEHHNADLENRNGFWFRRIFLTVDQTLSDTISGRLRFEMNGAGDFRSNTTLEPYVRDAWLRWRASQNLSLIVGLTPDPLTQVGEDFWGYRSLEKSPLDLHRMLATRDAGIGLQGKVAPKVHYHFLAGNGAGVGGETDSGKQFSVNVGLDSSSPLVLEAGVERNELDTQTRTTAQAVVGWRRGSNRAGLLYAHQSRDFGRSDVDLDIASVFGVYEARKNVVAVLRVDRMFHPNPEGAAVPYLPFDPQSKSTLAIAALDFKLNKSFGIIPNVEWVTYDGTSPTPNDDVIPRITFYYSY